MSKAISSVPSMDDRFMFWCDAQDVWSHTLVDHFWHCHLNEVSRLVWIDSRRVRRNQFLNRTTMFRDELKGNLFKFVGDSSQQGNFHLRDGNSSSWLSKSAYFCVLARVLGFGARLQQHVMPQHTPEIIRKQTTTPMTTYKMDQSGNDKD